MNETEIIVGHVYEAKRPKMMWNGFINDRAVLYRGVSTVQYDSPSVANGRHYPAVPIEKFLAWAGRDITDEMPKGEWREKATSPASPSGPSENRKAGVDAPTKEPDKITNVTLVNEGIPPAKVL